MPDDGAPVVFSAHGVPKSVPAEADAPRRCSPSTPPARWSPRSTARPSVHHKRGRTIVLIGHAGHPEVVGTMGQLPPGAVTAGRDRGRRRAPRSRAIPDSLAYVTQTTLSVDDTARDRRRRCGAASRRSSARTRKTSATPPPTARRRSRRSRRGRRADRGRRARTRRTRSAWSRSPSAPAARSRGWSSAPRDIDWALASTAIRRARHHRRRLGARGAGRGGDRRLRRSATTSTVEEVLDRRRERGLPAAARAARRRPAE